MILSSQSKVDYIAFVFCLSTDWSQIEVKELLDFWFHKFRGDPDPSWHWWAIAALLCQHGVALEKSVLVSLVTSLKPTAISEHDVASLSWPPYLHSQRALLSQRTSIHTSNRHWSDRQEIGLHHALHNLRHFSKALSCVLLFWTSLYF